MNTLTPASVVRFINLDAPTAHLCRIRFTVDLSDIVGQGACGRVMPEKFVSDQETGNWWPTDNKRLVQFVVVVGNIWDALNQLGHPDAQWG
ncbi:MAG: hypothetical protein F4X61_04100 [Rhodothermaceae bacterium]|nr:hypothetical protein [Rhodothermaceae bacterium]MYC03794.1 hypothetical protein [Rhodothermaceae bacterium]MYE63242.1 hypothetical protein [Rhodothermaceae bacterium]